MAAMVVLLVVRTLLLFALVIQLGCEMTSRVVVVLLLLLLLQLLIALSVAVVKVKVRW